MNMYMVVYAYVYVRIYVSVYAIVNTDSHISISQMYTYLCIIKRCVVQHILSLVRVS